MSNAYKINEFAKVAGVTVRTLHHYDRLGLLTPKRTGAGYRLYALGDLERLEQVIALKFLGLPLKQIKVLLDRDPLQLSNALRMQCTVLQEKRRLLARAIDAIKNAERVIQPGRPADSAVLRKIITALKVQDSSNFMKKYFSSEAWAKWSANQRQQSPEGKQRISQAWIDLFRDAEALLGEDPAGGEAQALAARWLALADASAVGDREVKAGFTKAWADHRHWPAKDRRRIAQFKIEKIVEFISEVMASSMKKYYSGEAWARVMRRRERSTPELRQRKWQAWLNLFRDVETSLGEDPAGKTAQALATRWTKLAKSSTGGDAAIERGWRRSWADRRHWPGALQEQLAAFDFDKILKFIKRAIAHSEP
ncbi:MAG: MerR family transcriptional regulator [Terriglobales bacterium]